MTDTSSPARTFKLNALKVTLHSTRADASGRWCGGAGLEENSNEGLIEPIGSDWLVTDNISLPSREGGAESQRTSGSVTRQLKPLDRIL